MPQRNTVFIIFKTYSFLFVIPIKVYEETGLTGYQIRLIAQKNMCLDTSTIQATMELKAMPCDIKSQFQRFRFDYDAVKV